MIKTFVKSILPEEIRKKIQEKNYYRYYQKLRNTPDNTYKRFDDTRSIFIHIPKAGGISIIKSLYGERADGIGHRPYDHFIFVYGEETFNSYFKFTFVRNPWDRLLSAYNFLKKGGMDSPDAIFNEKILSKFKNFEHFVFEGLAQENVMKYDHFIPQYKFLYSDKKSKTMVDFIGYFENFNEDYEKIRQKIGTGEKLKHLNKTPGKKEHNYRDAYTQDMAARVSEVYRKDIELFGYSF